MFGGDEISLGQSVNDLVANLPKRISHRIWEWIEAIPQAIAVQEAGRDWTYADLGSAILEARQHLKDYQVRGGDRIMLVDENACIQVAVILAASDLDIWVALINARLSGPELDAIRDDCKPRHIIYTVNISSDAKDHAVRHGATFKQHPHWGEFAHSGTLDMDPEPVFESNQDLTFIKLLDKVNLVNTIWDIELSVNLVRGTWIYAGKAYTSLLGMYIYYLQGDSIAIFIKIN
jgi:acyl-CoA synthetase (AMP-forming)/AMP-acid ligase II